MHNRKLYAWVGSAAAAVALLATVATLALRPEPVQAQTIMQGLRDSLARGFRVTFDNVGSDGTTLNGQLTVLFANIPADAGSAPAERELETLYGDVRVVSGPESEMAGADFRVTVAHSADSKWAYLRAHAIPENLAEADPLAGRLLNATRDGLLLDLSRLPDGGSVQSTPSRTQVTTGGVPAEIEPELQKQIDEAIATAKAEAAEGGTGGSVKSMVVSKVVTSDGAPPPNQNDAPDATRGALKLGFSFGGSTDQADAPAPACATSGFMMTFDSSSDSADSDVLSGLVRNILSGKAGQEELQELTELLNQSAAHATVEETEPGLFVLTARDFGSAAPDADLAADAVLRVGYRRDQGVVWARLENVEGGTIRLEAISEPIDPALLNKDRLIEAGVTRVIDAGNPWSLLGLLDAGDVE